jgi:hypothetical protein
VVPGAFGEGQAGDQGDADACADEGLDAPPVVLRMRHHDLQ